MSEVDRREPAPRRFQHIVTPTPQECRSAREQMGWTREHLAEIAGVKKRTVITYETGVRMPRAGTLIAIRRAFRTAGLSLGAVAGADEPSRLAP